MWRLIHTGRYLLQHLHQLPILTAFIYSAEMNSVAQWNSSHLESAVSFRLSLTKYEPRPTRKIHSRIVGVVTEWQGIHSRTLNRVVCTSDTGGILHCLNCNWIQLQKILGNEMENDLRCNVDHPFQPQKLAPQTPVSLAWLWRWLIYFHSLTSIIDNSVPAGEIL